MLHESINEFAEFHNLTVSCSTDNTVWFIHNESDKSFNMTIEEVKETVEEGLDDLSKFDMELFLEGLD